MNRLIKATMALGTCQKALCDLLDIPAETRGEDFEAKIVSAKTAVMAAHSEAEMAALAEPVVPEHRQETPEGLELRQMIDGANVGEMFDAVVNRGVQVGQIAELQSHLGLNANQIPLALLETRAVTPAPTNVGQDQQSIIPYVFPASSAAFLGVDMPTVGVGEAVFPVLTSTLTVGTPAENADQDETTGSFSATVLSASRLQASFEYSREDRSRFAGMDAALRSNLSEGLADGLDKAILNGTKGLFHSTNLPNNNITVNDTFDSYLNNLCWNQIDGRYASTAKDLAMVVGAATLKDLGQTYRNTSVDRSALDRLMELTSGVRVSAHVPAPSTNRQNVVIRRGMSRTAVAPLWEGVTIIADEVTKAKAGQLVITAVLLYSMAVLRTGAGLVKQGTDHS